MTVTALQPSTVMRIPRTLFLKILDGFPSAALRLRDHMASRTEELTRELAQMTERIAPRDTAAE
jgi:CRP-like cAMP-binding protein